MKKHWIKIALTIFLLGAAFICFYFPDAVEITETVCSNPNIEQKTNNYGFIKLMHYIGLFCLVFSVWIWREILKIDSIGIIGGSSLRSADPKVFNKNLSHESKSNSVDRDFKENELNDAKKAIVQIMRESYSSVTRITLLSSKLKIPRNTIERCLFQLQIEGIVRKDIVPGTLVGNYSLSDSWLNRAIDDFRSNLIKSKVKVVSDLRYVKINSNREIDALIETEQNNYVIEIKSISKHIDSKVIERGIKQLLVIEEDFKSQKPLQLVLIFVLHRDLDLDIGAHLEEYDDVKDNLTISTFRLE